ncbi:hypothetical protein LC087_15300 [Bacillus carboniphilus]|uniref:DNA-binding protein n=1 Tax=Bacillus carboniphilus TaxID=86663 RepID=A0ABY9JRT4_9BACI|nr:hypothetical protein [Bacillus carboniphilus]WLR42115.1 hypothetical protein LC087_15300 [Bacillus carboniphilus]
MSKLIFNNEDELRVYIKTEVLTSNSVRTHLNIGRARLQKIIEQGTLKPFIKEGNVQLFYKADVLEAEKKLKKNEKYKPKKYRDNESEE